MTNQPDVTKIAELPDSNGTCIICKKSDGSFILKNDWADVTTKWQQISRQYLLHILDIQFHLSATEAEEIANR